MMIFDFECDTPTVEVIDDTVRLIESNRGFDKEGYVQRMGGGWARRLSLTMPEFEALKAEKGLRHIALALCDLDRKTAMSDADVIAMLDDAGVQYACIGNAGRRASNEDVARLAAKYPDRLIPWFRIWGDEGEAGVRALEHGVRELGCRGFEVSSYRENRAINDPAYHPFFAKCVELGIPARITVGVHLLSDRPYDYAHPRHIDEVAIRFPELKIVAGLGGWPWILDMVAIAIRHPNVHIDFACHRVTQLMMPGGGYEPLLAHGQLKPLQDRILFGSGWGSMGVPLKQMVEETAQLPLDDKVREKWMGLNAARLMGVG